MTGAGVLVLSLTAIGTTFGGEPMPPLHPLEQAVLVAREPIRDAHLVIEVETHDRRYSSHPLRYRYETWSEWDRQRTEITPLDEATRTAPGRDPNPFLYCYNCPERGKVLGLCRRFSALKIAPPDIPHPAGAGDSMRLDAKRLGLIFAPLWNVNGYNAAEKVGLSRQAGFLRAEERLNGRQVARHTATPKPGHTHSIWIDSDRGPSVVRVEYTGPNPRPGRPNFRSVMDVVPVLDPVTEIWFFSSYTQTSIHIDDQEVKETATVKTLELNRGIDPAVFTWAGLNIDSGTPFMRYADHDTITFNGYWDGTREVPSKEYMRRPEFRDALQVALPPEPVGQPSAAGPQVWQYVLAVGLAVTGLFVVIRAVRRRPGV